MRRVERAEIVEFNEECIPELLLKSLFDGTERTRKINWRIIIPEQDYTIKILVMSTRGAMELTF